MAYTEITPQEYDIKLIRNDDWNRVIPVYSDDEETPFDFTGWSGVARVRKKENDTSSVIEFSSGAGTMTLETGKITLIADKANTDIEPQNYRWDLEFTDADGLSRTLIKNSSFDILEDVT